jgi:ATP-dependent DNA helicase RecQ
LVSLNKYRTGIPLEEIAKERNLSIETIQNHLLRCEKEGFEVNWDSMIPPKLEAKILERCVPKIIDYIIK